MKHTILFTLASFLLALSSLAQRDAESGEIRKGEPEKQFLTRSLDTLFHFGGFYYTVNSNDFDDFEMLFQDFDGFTPHPNNYYEDSEWAFYYEALGGGDTLDWVETTSWFEEPGQANDWITLGPLTIPSDGATFSWRAYHNPSYQNGYEIKLSTSGIDPENFNTEPLYVVEDFYDENSTGIDTNSYFQDPPKSFDLPDSVAGRQVYFAFHHNSFDMDVLHLSDFVLKRKTTSVNEINRDITEVSAFPNPANQDFTVRFDLKSTQRVTFTLMDLAGSILKKGTKPDIRSGEFNIDVSVLSPGIYFYSIQTNRDKITKKVIVQ
ncbi:MAG TPA: T9SS type A sorting domain-containing protein [Bacteroidales bacterium]|nr:T9SS type A sorting domain-containing protein [Bacteroidales bacterium]